MADVKIVVDLHAIREATDQDVIRIDSILRAVASVPLQFQDDFANSGNVLTLSQLFAGVGPTYDALADTPMSKAGHALEFVRVNAAGTLLEYFAAVSGVTKWVDLDETPNPLVDDRIPFSNPGATSIIFDDDVRADQVKTAEPAQSGIIGQFSGEISVASGTEVLVTSGNAELIERITDTHFARHKTSWGTQTIVVPGGALAEAGAVILIEDPGFTGSGTPVAVDFGTATADYMRERAKLGYSFHESGVVIDTIDAVDVYKDLGQVIADLSEALGIVKESGTGIHQEIAASLTSSVTQAKYLGRGINFRAVADGEGNPNKITIPADALLVFDTIDGDGNVFSAAISVFPKTWNDGGSETALTGKKAAVMQVWQLPNGTAYAQLGTTQHNDFATAKSKILDEIIGNPPPDILKRIGSRLSYVIIANDQSVWITDGAEILAVDSSGSIGGNGGVITGQDIALYMNPPHIIQDNTANVYSPSVARNVVSLMVQGRADTEAASGSFAFQVFHGSTIALATTPVGTVVVLQGTQRGETILGSPVAIPADSVFVTNTTDIGAFPISTKTEHKQFALHIRMTAP